jgi:hypothetical protein
MIPRFEARIAFIGNDAELLTKAALVAGMTIEELVYEAVRNQYGLRQTINRADTIGPRLVRLHSTGMTDIDMAALLRVSVTTVVTRRKALGLSANYKRRKPKEQQ